MKLTGLILTDWEENYRENHAPMLSAGSLLTITFVRLGWSIYVVLSHALGRTVNQPLLRVLFSCDGILSCPAQKAVCELFSGTL